jgi:TatD DNase family protein
VAEQCLKRGFYLSFGEHFHDEALRSTPLERLLLETDESRLSMEEICRKAASVYGLPAEILAARITSNAQKVLFLQ